VAGTGGGSTKNAGPAVRHNKCHKGHHSHEFNLKFPPKRNTLPSIDGDNESVANARKAASEGDHERIIRVEKLRLESALSL
jgi:hypothetical protein